MIVFELILALAIIALLVTAAVKRDWDYATLSFLPVLLLVISLLLTVKFSIGSQQLTGYIYSSSDGFGYTTAHIRFSQNAGEDAQPKFCFPSNSDAAKQVNKYVGTNQKVKVYIPPYFYVANNPFACGTGDTSITADKENK